MTREKWTKDFDGWNNTKKWRERRAGAKQLFHAGQIWWCSVGVNLGVEIDGKNRNYERPVLIIKKCNDKVFIGTPLTSKIKEGSFFKEINYNERTGTAVLVQTKTMSSKRLLRNMYEIDNGELTKVVEAYIGFLRN